MRRRSGEEMSQEQEKKSLQDNRFHRCRWWTWNVNKSISVCKSYLPLFCSDFTAFSSMSRRSNFRSHAGLCDSSDFVETTIMVVNSSSIEGAIYFLLLYIILLWRWTLNRLSLGHLTKLWASLLCCLEREKANEGRRQNRVVRPVERTQRTGWLLFL